MRITSLVAAAALLLVQGEARASDIKVMGVPSVKSALDILGPQFERASGHKLVMNYAGSSELIRRFAANEAFDVAMVWPALIEQMMKDGRLVARAEVARVGIAVAVRKGAPKPDISTAEAFKRTLLNAASVSHSLEGASGVHFKSVLDRLGIAAAMQPKLRPQPGGPYVVGPVARGEAELAVVSSPYIALEAGADLVGPLPDELQDYVIYTAGIAATARDPAAARALVRHLTSPAAAPVLRSQGLDPATP
jgi:molybdate transport system substrate-binding protein